MYVILKYWFPFSALTAELRHTTLLEELVFWTVKYEFPERLVCLLLKLLPDTQYKEALTRSFVRHYSRVSMMLMKSHNSDKLSNRIVHVSVQLFSNEELGTYIYWVLLFKIILKLLKDYVPHVQEFNAGGGSMGFHIMTCLLQSSETLRLLLFLLDEGVGALESYQVSTC